MDELEITVWSLYSDRLAPHWPLLTDSAPMLVGIMIPLPECCLPRLFTWGHEKNMVWHWCGLLQPWLKAAVDWVILLPCCPDAAQLLFVFIAM